MNIEAITGEVYSAIQYHGLIKTLYTLFSNRVKIEIGFTQKRCDTPIENIPLSVRCYNALRRANISTVGEAVTAINSDALLKIRGLGLKSRSEIRVTICEYGYSCLSEWAQKGFIRKIVREYAGEKKC